MYKQIRIHGRGGQGVVTAAELVAIAAFHSGYYAQAFPSFGVERTGAPIASFVRISNTEIRTREQVYNPDILIIQDASLLESVNVASDCDPKTLIVINTSKEKEQLKLTMPADRIHPIDATSIALKVLGKNIVNTVIIGALAKATGLITLEGLEKAVKQKFGRKNPEIVKKNIEAVRLAYKYTK